MSVEMKAVMVPAPADGRRVVCFEADKALVVRLRERIDGKPREAERIGKRFEGLLAKVVEDADA